MDKKQKVVKDRRNCTLKLINGFLAKSTDVTFVLLFFSALVSLSNLLQNMTIGSSRNRLTKQSVFNNDYGEEELLDQRMEKKQVCAFQITVVQCIEEGSNVGSKPKSVPNEYHTKGTCKANFTFFSQSLVDVNVVM